MQILTFGISRSSLFELTVFFGKAGPGNDTLPEEISFPLVFARPRSLRVLEESKTALVPGHSPKTSVQKNQMRTGKSGKKEVHKKIRKKYVSLINLLVEKSEKNMKRSQLAFLEGEQELKIFTK